MASILDASTIRLVQGQDKVFFVDLFYEDTQEPFDLTGATEIVASFPPITGATVEEKLSATKVAVSGPAGAGKIQITCSAADTLLMNAPGNPQGQDLQINVTIGGKVSIFILTAVLNILPSSYVVV